MRVRITKPLTGSIDGIQLSRLSQGHVYDVYTSLACYLLSEELAEPAGSDDEPSAILPVENKLFERPETPSKGLILPPSIAEDRARKLRARRKKKKKES